jgi:hypothetical protein
LNLLNRATFVKKFVLTLFSFPYNNLQAGDVCKGTMAKAFRVTGTVENRVVIWFVDRSTEPGGYSLDERFSREEAKSLETLLQSRNLECRIEEIPGCAIGAQSVSWNLLGSIFELGQSDGDQLSLPVVGCVVY